MDDETLRMLRAFRETALDDEAELGLGYAFNRLLSALWDGQYPSRGIPEPDVIG